MSRLKAPVDVVVLTPLEEERDAFVEATQAASVRIVGSDISFSLRPRADVEIAGVVVCPADMGRTEAAIATTRAILLYRPRIVLLCGRAGGIRFWEGWVNSQIQLGDVLVCTRLVDLDVRKILHFGVDEVKPREPKLPAYELACAQEVARDDKWQGKVEKGVQKPAVHFGPLISSNVVLASEYAQVEVIERAQAYTSNYSGRPIGIEMEGIGVALATNRLKREMPELSNLRYIMIRGVSDFADSMKSSDEIEGRVISSCNAARFSVDFLIDYFLNLGSHATIDGK